MVAYLSIAMLKAIGVLACIAYRMTFKCFSSTENVRIAPVAPAQKNFGVFVTVLHGEHVCKFPSTSSNLILLTHDHMLSSIIGELTML